MATEVTIVLSESMSAVLGDAPLTLTLNPSGFGVTSAPIVKIEYEFGDGTDNQIVRRRLSVTEETSAFAYQSDLGDPRNVIVQHNYFPSVSGDFGIYYLKAHVTKSDTFIPATYTLQVVVDKIDAVNGMADGYFEDIHLIGLRAHGTTNVRTMLFETKNPRYLTCVTYDNAVMPMPIPTPTVTPTPTP